METKTEEKNKIIPIADITQNPTIVEFHKLFYILGNWGMTWNSAKYMGVKMLKNPLDMQLFQEIIHEIKPGLIIETGTAWGGSALYFAHLLDQLSSGKVLSIDIENLRAEYPRHPRITYLSGLSSVHPKVLQEVQEYVKPCCPTMVILDSDHSQKHVLAELNAYAKFVSPGSYLIVEDTNINGHPVFHDYGDGPQEALDLWLPHNKEFKEDEARKTHYLFSFNTYLKKRRA